MTSTEETALRLWWESIMKEWTQTSCYICRTDEQVVRREWRRLTDDFFGFVAERGLHLYFCAKCDHRWEPMMECRDTIGCLLAEKVLIWNEIVEEEGRIFEPKNLIG